MSDSLLKTSYEDSIYSIALARPAKRNAINDRLLAAIDRALDHRPEEARVVVLSGEGQHFCAGLDLSEHQHREPFGVMLHSQGWHRVFRRIQHGGVPVIAALHGDQAGSSSRSGQEVFSSESACPRSSLPRYRRKKLTARAL